MSAPYSNKELIDMSKEITIAALNGGNFVQKTQIDKYTAAFMQAVYDKLSEWNDKAD